MAVYNIGFIMEQTLGHVTHTQNLQLSLPRDTEVRTHWALVPRNLQRQGLRIPSVRLNWTLAAGLRARAALGQLARSARLDALLFHTHVPAMLATDWLHRVPSVVSLDATPLQYDQFGTYYRHTRGPSWIERIKWHLNRNCYHAARHLVSWSNWTKNSLVEGYGISSDKVTVVPPGVQVREWRRPTPRLCEQGPTKILFVGGNFERKGGPLLLEAFRALRPLDVELHLVTQQSIAPEPGLFVYNNLQPNSSELKALYHQCHIFALPTNADCLPMALCKAGAAGLATVATNIAAIPEIVRNNETGLLIPVGDARALQDALRRLILQPELRLYLGERALAHTVHAYDAQKNAGRLLDLLKGEVDVARLHMGLIV
jgi:glycosyltransferase involved in cell wall biosynthesis